MTNKIDTEKLSWIFLLLASVKEHGGEKAEF